MSNILMDWVEETEKKQKEERSKEYFNIEEGENRFVLLSHCAPLALKWTGSRYEVASEGDKNSTIRGVCWVWQDGLVKSAKLPYSVVKSIRAILNHSEWGFDEFPFKHVFTLNAKNAGDKSVEYILNASPKETEVPQAILDELAKKPSPEELIEKMKGKRAPQSKVDYPQDNINPDDIPF